MEKITQNRNSDCCWYYSKVKYYVVQKAFNAESSLHEAFRKLGHGPLEDSTKNALEKTYLPAL